jgi:hypothetical protein
MLITFMAGDVGDLVISNFFMMSALEVVGRVTLLVGPWTVTR